ncbi:hypothetical protein P9112_007703 [Eukaryota sp. TZLM1-RC]
MENVHDEPATLDELDQLVAHLTDKSLSLQCELNKVVKTHPHDLPDLVSNIKLLKDYYDKLPSLFSLSFSSSSLSSLPSTIADTFSSYHNLPSQFSFHSSGSVLFQCPSEVKAAIESCNYQHAVDIAMVFKEKYNELTSEPITSSGLTLLDYILDGTLDHLKILQSNLIDGLKRGVDDDCVNSINLIRDCSRLLPNSNFELSDCFLCKIYLDGQSKIINQLVDCFYSRTRITLGVIIDLIDDVSSQIKSSVNTCRSVFFFEPFVYNSSYKSNKLLLKFVFNSIQSIVDLFQNYFKELCSYLDINQSISIISELIGLSNLISQWGFDFNHLFAPILRDIVCQKSKEHVNISLTSLEKGQNSQDFELDTPPEEFNSASHLLVVKELNILINILKPFFNYYVLDVLQINVENLITKSRELFPQFDDHFEKFLLKQFKNQLNV